MTNDDIQLEINEKFINYIDEIENAMEKITDNFTTVRHALDNLNSRLEQLESNQGVSNGTL